MCIRDRIVDWPQNIGGKPSFSFQENMPAFVPVMFELTVFFTGHLMVITFYLRSRLWPFKKAENPIPETTDDKFLIQIPIYGNESKIKSILKKTDLFKMSIIDAKKENNEEIDNMTLIGLIIVGQVACIVEIYMHHN